MKSRLLALCMMFVLIAALVPGVMAQDSAVCGNLTGDDCTALTTAFTNTAASSSGAFTLDTTIDIQSDDPSQALNLTIKADGKFNGVSPTAMTDVSAITDPASALTSLSGGLKGFSGELNFSIGLPAEAAAMTGGEPLVLNLILIDGIGYIDFSKLPASIAPLLQQMKIPNSWAGLDLIDTITNLGPMLTSSMDTPTTTAPTADLAKYQGFATKYLVYTRSGDTYTGTVDLAGLFSDPEFQAAMKSGESATEMTAADEAAIASLKDAKVEIVYVLNGDKVGQIKANISIPGSTLAALDAAGSSESTSAPPTAVNITLDMSYSGLGEAQTVAAPAGAPVASYMELMTIVSGMMGSMGG